MVDKVSVLGVEEKLENLKIALIVYNQRKKECKFGDNHIKPDYNSNRCGHCYNLLSYETHKVQEILNDREGLHLNHQPMDASSLMDVESRELSSMKLLDSFKAIDLVLNELENKGLLKKLKGNLSETSLYKNL